MQESKLPVSQIALFLSGKIGRADNGVEVVMVEDGIELATKWPKPRF